MIIKILFVPLLSLSLAEGQFKVTGRVTDEETNQPIAFVNIGILNSKTGTISNTDGSYEINIPDSLKSEKIIFSAIGYERRELALGELLKDPIIKLTSKVTRLKNVDIIASKKSTSRWLGNTKRAFIPGGTMNYDSASAGGAKAILIENDQRLTHVKEAKLLIMRNTLPKFKIRIRFLGSDNHTGLPAEDLISKSIVLTSDMRKGWLTFDLSEYNISIDKKKFFLVFEWLYEEKDRFYIAKSYDDFIENNPDQVIRDTANIDGVMVPTTHVQNFIVGTFFATISRSTDIKCYGRDNSFDEWTPSPSIISAKVLMTD